MQYIYFLNIVREKSRFIVSLIENPQKLKEERKKYAGWKGRIEGVGGGVSSSSYSSGSYGSIGGGNYSATSSEYYGENSNSHSKNNKKEEDDSEEEEEEEEEDNNNEKEIKKNNGKKVGKNIKEEEGEESFDDEDDENDSQNKPEKNNNLTAKKLNDLSTHKLLDDKRINLRVSKEKFLLDAGNQNKPKDLKELRKTVPENNTNNVNLFLMNKKEREKFEELSNIGGNNKHMNLFLMFLKIFIKNVLNMTLILLLNFLQNRIMILLLMEILKLMILKKLCLI